MVRTLREGEDASDACFGLNENFHLTENTRSNPSAAMKCPHPDWGIVEISICTLGHRLLGWSVEVFPPDGGVGILLEFIRRLIPMKTTMRGRPRLDLDLNRILAAIRSHRQVMAAARDLGCSEAYIHVRLKKVGLSLRVVLEAPDLRSLLHGES